MAGYVDRAVPRPPKTLTEAEQQLLLRTSGEHRDGFRDHVLYSLALGTALREHELVALNVGDVTSDGEHVRRRFPLRVFKQSNRDASEQEARLPDDARYKLATFLKWKAKNGEPLDLEAPLFLSRHKKRLSTRMVRHAFSVWQSRAGFERRVTFHALRHSALSNLYRLTKDIRLVQRVARHKSVDSTAIYEHASEEDLMQAIRALPC